MRLLLVRHGESVHSVRGLVSGVGSCPGLTVRGWGQARAVRERLVGVQAEVVLSSPVRRARETAGVLVSAFPGVRAVQVDCDLCELHVGEGDGLPVNEFRARYGAFDPVDEPHRPLSPGGEDWAAFGERVRRTLRDLAAVHEGRTVVVVTHAGFVVKAFLELFGVPRPGTRTRFDPGFGSVTEWAYDAAGPAWRLVGIEEL